MKIFEYLKMIDEEKETLDKIDFYQLMGTGKLIIFSEEYSEEAITSLYSIFAGVVKENERVRPGYINFLYSREALFEKIFNETKKEDIVNTFLSVEIELNQIYIGETTNVSAKTLFKFFSAIIKNTKDVNGQ